MKDEKAWKEIQKLLDAREEFSSCPSVEGNLELLREGSRVFCRGNDGGRWAEERSRRVMEIKAAMVEGCRMIEEERRLGVIRGRKRGDNLDEWDVISTRTCTDTWEEVE